MQKSEEKKEVLNRKFAQLVFLACGIFAVSDAHANTEDERRIHVGSEIDEKRLKKYWKWDGGQFIKTKSFSKRLLIEYLRKNFPVWNFGHENSGNNELSLNVDSHAGTNVKLVLKSNFGKKELELASVDLLMPQEHVFLLNYKAEDLNRKIEEKFIRLIVSLVDERLDRLLRENVSLDAIAKWDLSDERYPRIVLHFPDGKADVLEGDPIFRVTSRSSDYSRFLIFGIGINHEARSQTVQDGYLDSVVLAPRQYERLRERHRLNSNALSELSGTELLEVHLWYDDGNLWFSDESETYDYHGTRATISIEDLESKQ